MVEFRCRSMTTILPCFRWQIRATELFKALDFHRGCQYGVERGASGELAPGTFDGFCGLIDTVAAFLRLRR